MMGEDDKRRRIDDIPAQRRRVDNRNGGGGGSVSTLYDPANWPDLRNYYALEGTSKDYVGNLDLSEFGTVNYVNGVKNTQGISTENSDSGFGKIDVSIPTDGLTWSTFVRTKDSTPTAPSVTETDQSGNFVASVLTLTESGGVLAGQVRTDQGVIGLGSSISPSGGNTYHMALTFDGSDVRLLINGSIEVEKTNVGSAIDDSGIISIFVSDSNQSEWIDETMLFNRALSQSEINTIYQKGTSTGSTSTLYDPANWSSMKAYYPFNGDFKDDAGSFDLSGVNSPSFVSGVDQDGVSLNGTDQYLEDSDFSFSPTSEVSITGWINLNSVPGNDAAVTGVFPSGGGSPDFGIGVDSTPNVLAAVSHADGTATPLRNGNVQTGTKHFIAMTYDGSNLEIYLDGSTPVDSASTSKDIRTKTDHFWLGKDVNTGVHLDANYIDEIAIFNKGLTDSEIDTLYQKGI